VFVDDLIPHSKKGPAFAYSQSGALWVPILEKAMASAYGCVRAHVLVAISDLRLLQFI
jgi:hypothetical protein